MTAMLGARIKLLRDVNRLFFVARAGLTGTIVYSAEGMVRVKMDETLNKCEKWNNEIVWNNLDEFKDEVECQVPPGFSGDVGV